MATPEPDLFTRVRFHRMAAAIERCHIKPHALRYSVGHHTHDAVTLFIQCWREAHDGRLPRAEAITAMHIHDHPEIVTGDVASPIKDLLGEKLKLVDGNVENWLGFGDLGLTPEEILYINAADRFEFFCWAYEEAYGRGNADVLDWADSYERKWKEDPLPWPFMELMDAIIMGDGRTPGLHQLERDTLFQAGGLS